MASWPRSRGTTRPSSARSGEQPRLFATVFREHSRVRADVGLVSDSARFDLACSSSTTTTVDRSRVKVVDVMRLELVLREQDHGPVKHRGQGFTSAYAAVPTGPGDVLFRSRTGTEIRNR